jgi:hypothetical protein
MDRQIKKVKKKIDKDMDKLVKMDIPRDKKLEKCDKEMKSKKK